MEATFLCEQTAQSATLLAAKQVVGRAEQAQAIDRAYFIILNKIDELDGTNERLLKYYRENIENSQKI